MVTESIELCDQVLVRFYFSAKILIFLKDIDPLVKEVSGFLSAMP